MIVRRGVDGDIVREIPVEHVQIEKDAGGTVIVTNQSNGQQEFLAANDFDATRTYTDLIVEIDLSVPVFSHTPALQLENAYSNPFNRMFSPQSDVSGTDQDAFRVSVSNSSSTWNRSGRTELLTRVFWDFADSKSNSTGYYDAQTIVRPVMRWNRYSGRIDRSRTVTVATDHLRPDEVPDSAVAEVQQNIAMTVDPTAPTACASFENQSTWRRTDQIFNAGCSTAGSDIRYSWFYNNSWTSETTSSIHEFFGHEESGAQSVSMKVRNVSTGLWSTTTYPFNVINNIIGIVGPTYIATKGTYRYSTGNDVFGWWERFNPGSWRYALTPDSVLNRTWPAGNYTVDLRQEETGDVLKRGRLAIEVCTENCGFSPSMAAMRIDTNTEPDIFGMGPIVTWANGGVRFYDLFGSPDVTSRLSAKSWFSESGVQIAGMDGGHLVWSKVNSPLGSVSKVDVSFPDDREAVFGFAFDPDLGTSAADDRSGYDHATGMAFVFDDQRATGILVRRARGNAIASVNQFGIRRLPPVSAKEVHGIIRRPGTHLLSGRSDVQLIVSTTPFTGNTAQYVIVLRAKSVTELQAKAAQVIKSF